MSDSSSTVDAAPLPWPAASRLAWLVFLAGLSGFVLWASFAPLAEGVPAPGQVSIDTKRKAVQHLQGGIVRQVLVREGQQVEEGDLLLKLDVLAVQASLEAVRKDIAASQENLVALQGTLAGLQRSEKLRREQLANTERELAGIRDLVREGFAPLVRQLQLESTQADLLAAINDLVTNQLRTRQSMLELEHRTQASRSRLVSVTQDLSLLEIRAPVKGQVVGLQVQSVGAVVQAAQRLMDIVPEGEPLIVESRVPPAQIDRLQPGQSVDVRFLGFPQAPQLVVQGRLSSLSKDALNDPEGKTSYYLARIDITPEGRKQLGGLQLQSGMPAEVIILTGGRTVLAYLLHPLLRRLSTSMKEF